MMIVRYVDATGRPAVGVESEGRIRPLPENTTLGGLLRSSPAHSAADRPDRRPSSSSRGTAGDERALDDAASG